MKEQKNIDRLFQEKFKNFEATPDDAIWDRIHTQLHDKKKEERKIIPIWWKIAGIAAGLALLVSIGYGILNTSADSQNQPEVVNTENPTETKNAIKPQEDLEVQDAKNNIINNNLVSEDNAVASENSNPVSEDETHDNNTNASSNKTSFFNKKSTVTQQYQNQTTGNSNRVTNTSDAEIKGQLNNKTTTNNATVSNKNKETGVAVTTQEIPQNLPEQPALDQKINTTTIPSSTTEEGITEVTNTEKEDPIKNTTADAQKMSIEDAIASAEDDDDINEKEKDVLDRWSVTPNVAPVYFNSLGSSGSSIHGQFDNNSKSGDLNMSYGVTAAYALSDKLAVRTGVSRVNVGYKTNEVIVYQSIGTTSSTDLLRNIKLDPSAGNTAIISSESLAFAQVPDIVSRNFKASLNQDISFIEVPVELEYKLVDKKVDINVIGGFSTMFLNDNTIYAEILNETTPIGEANNINDVSFSANFGIGLEVKLSKRMNLNLEPTFKYQINTFNNTSGDFKPYIIGVNSGLKFKF